MAVVTGAGRGIGQSVAERLASEGAAVAVVDLDETAARHVADGDRGGGRPGDRGALRRHERRRGRGDGRARRPRRSAGASTSS
ncbi:MAG: SDR family NAD(P)-dependent oxidoreductase [Tetrasphaera sp.]